MMTKTRTKLSLRTKYLLGILLAIALIAAFVQIRWTSMLVPMQVQAGGDLAAADLAREFSPAILKRTNLGNATFSKSAKEKTRALRGQSQSFLVPEYSRVIQWDVSPNFTNFDLMPIRQFCRWRGGNKHQRTRVQKTNHWKIRDTELVIPVDKKQPNMTLLEITYDCQRILKESPYGTGNWVQLLYIMRMAVASMPNSKMDLKMTCRDAIDQPEKLVMPWLMGHFSSEKTMQIFDRYFGKDKVSRKCSPGGWGELPIGWMLPWIRDDLRRMAIAVVGLPQNDPDHPAHAWSASDYNVMYSDSSISGHSDALVPGVVLDDTVIHFRCGDIMLSQELYFRFFKYHEFSRRIYPNTTSIGIVTQPFGKSDQSRDRDQANVKQVELCKRVILGFQDFLRASFPQARVSIHNDPQETVGLAYARLVMAKYQAFAWPDSSFSVYPALATFGKSYHMVPLRSPYKRWFPKNQFLHEIKPYLDVDSQFEWMNVPNKDGLFGIETFHMENMLGEEAIVSWFVNSSQTKPSFPMMETWDSWEAPDLYGDTERKEQGKKKKKKKAK